MTIAQRFLSVTDTLLNLITGMGTSKDRTSQAVAIVRELQKDDLENMYRGDWVARKIVTAPAQDATRAWRAWQAPNDQIEKIEEAEQLLAIQFKTRRALTLRRLYGGAALILGVKGSGKGDTELNLERLGEGCLQFVHCVSRHELSTEGGLETDLTSPYYGEPQMYVRQSAEGNRVLIHPSRVIRFNGEPLPDPAMASDGWGESVLQAVYDAVLSAGIVSSSVASLVEDSKLDIIKIPELTKTLQTRESADRLIRRFTLINQSKSITNSVLLDAKDEWERLGVNWGGLPDILKMYLLIASGAADIPATRMLGQSPSGLNSTGESDIRNYYDRISSDQENDLSPAMVRLDDILVIHATGQLDGNIFYEWNPLWQMTEVERADVALKKAQSTKLDMDMMLIPTDALAKGRQNQLIEDGTYPGLEKALEESDGEVTNPALEAQMEVELQKAEAGVEGESRLQKQGHKEMLAQQKQSQKGAEKIVKLKPKKAFGKDDDGEDDSTDLNAWLARDYDESEHPRDEDGKWTNKAGGDAGGIREHPKSAMREYTGKELDWEHGVEYEKYSKPSFPHAFKDRRDFDEQFAAAPLRHLSLEELRKLRNSMAASGHGKGENWVHRTFGHRRDTVSIVKELAHGKTAPPIVLEREDGKLHLMAGQTRLAAGLAFNRSVPVKVIPVRKRLKDEHLDDYDPDQPRDSNGKWVETGAGESGPSQPGTWAKKGTPKDEPPEGYVPVYEAGTGKFLGHKKKLHGGSKPGEVLQYDPNSKKYNWLGSAPAEKSQFKAPVSEPKINYAEKLQVSEKAAQQTKNWLKNHAEYLQETLAGNKLTNQEASALQAYTGSAYKALNYNLRTGKGSLAGMDYHNVNYVNALDSAFSKASAPRGMTLYRGVSKTVANDIRQHVGGEWTDHGYVSTSVSKSFAKKWSDEAFAVVVPKGARALPLKGTFSGHLIEEEVLLKRGSTFSVKQVPSGRIYLELKKRSHK